MLRHAVQIAGIDLGLVAVGIDHEERPAPAALAVRAAGEVPAAGELVNAAARYPFGPNIVEN